MDVCLIDVDSKIPNLALMKASTWHKRRGDTVKLGYEPLFDEPDLCYVSKVFEFTDEPLYMPDCETLRGGPGYPELREVRMPFDVEGEEYDRIMPDYGIYRERYPKTDMAIGRFTRGCIRSCPWCVVPKMDGHKVRHVADLADFWDGQGTVRLLDDNILADGDEFCRDCEQLHEAGVDVIWEALDIRLITDETARALATVRAAKTIHFAWDSHAQDDAVPKGIEVLRRNGVKPYKLTFYVLIGFGTDREYDEYRVRELRRLGAWPYVMPFDRSDPYQRFFARYVNNKFVFGSCPTFDDYEPWVRYRRQIGEIA